MYVNNLQSIVKGKKNVSNNLGKDIHSLCWTNGLTLQIELIFTLYLCEEVFQSVLIYKDNFAPSVELLTFAIIDVISKVLSKYLIERKTMLEGGVELSQENY